MIQDFSIIIIRLISSNTKKNHARIIKRQEDKDNLFSEGCHPDNLKIVKKADTFYQNLPLLEKYSIAEYDVDLKKSSYTKTTIISSMN